MTTLKLVKPSNMAEEKVHSNDSGTLSSVCYEIIKSPINIALVGIITFLVYKIIKSRQRVPVPEVREPELPKLRKDFTVEELKKYDGHNAEVDNRILVAVNGKIFDVTKGKRFYGPGGPYSAFGGRDASRGLATFSVVSTKDGYDDLSDLNTLEMESVREWEMQFQEKYDFVGRLLKPGEEPSNYSDEDEDTTPAEPTPADRPKSE